MTSPAALLVLSAVTFVATFSFSRSRANDIKKLDLLIMQIEAER
ncbi:unnamed protein product [Prunus brigantina]